MTLVTLKGPTQSLYTGDDPRELFDELTYDVLAQEPFNAGRWQQLDVSGSSLHDTHELLNVSVTLPVSSKSIEPWASLPWANDHFLERVGGVPVNPGDTHWYWPFHGKAEQEKLHMRSGGIYDHNYMERYWPKNLFRGRMGYRFPIGDLIDVVIQLKKELHTRQAYLPVWFPEDTGARQNQRVPCSLGYHFIVRDGKLHCQYAIRSCDIWRHFANDIYMTMRLVEWIAMRIEVDLGDLHMHIVSLHAFVGDLEKLETFHDPR